MKILQINCVYKTGSTGKIVYGLHTELTARGFESIVCYGRGDSTDDTGVYKTCGENYSKLSNLLTRFTGLMYGGCRLSTRRLISIIEREKPDVVHLHCINGYFVNIYRLISWLRDNKIKTLLTLHAEFIYTANCGHALECEKWKTGCGNCPDLRGQTHSLLIDGTARSWNRMKEAFDGFDEDLIVTSVSPWLMERAKQSPILADKRQFVVLNGVDTGIFHPYHTAGLRERHGITDERIIFHATPSFNTDPGHIKGGYYVTELAKLLKKDNIRMLVAGSYDKSVSVPGNVTLLGKISDGQLLAQYYSMADLTLLTSKKETFSMVCAESLCCGTPVAGFKAGAPEQIALPQYSRFTDYGDTDQLAASVREMLRRPKDSGTYEAAAAKYGKQVMAEEYIKLYKMLIKS